MNGHDNERTKPVAVLKSVGPKLVPFFKTVAIYFVLYGDGSKLDSLIYCVIKLLPVISLIIFVLLHGMSLADYYAYSRKILIGLVFSLIGDTFLVWKSSGYFVHGLLMFAVAQVMYMTAFGFRPLSPGIGAILFGIAMCIYSYLLPGLHGCMVYMVFFYVLLIAMMGWRAIARVQFFDDLWTWTKLCSCFGSICFIISDTVIAIDKFLVPMTYSHQIIMVTYYAAQFGITLSVVDSQVDALLKKRK
jgi:uncharacterized membrane protein YhhN